MGIDDFLIPLNTEGLRPDEITWNLQPINYIAFSPSWSDGLASLLEKLQSVDAPRVLSDGPRIAVESIVASSAVRNEPEILLSNCFKVSQMPQYLRRYRVESKLSIDERRALRKKWACRDVSPKRILAFDEPPSVVNTCHNFRYVDRVSWRDTGSVDGIDTRDLVVSLIHKLMHRKLEAHGMVYWEDGKQWYLPRGLLKEDRVAFTFPNGRSSWFKGVGERTYPAGAGGQIYRYHLSPSFSILGDQADSFVLLLRNRLYLTDVRGLPLEGRKIVSRRKHLCKGWFNYEWCARILGIAQLLADKDMCIRFGPEGEQQLVISAMPIATNAPQRIDDELVDEPDEIYIAWHEEGGEVDDVEVDEGRPDVE